MVGVRESKGWGLGKGRGGGCGGDGVGVYIMTRCSPGDQVLKVEAG